MIHVLKSPLRYLGLSLILLLPLLVFAQDAAPLAPSEITGLAIYIPFPVNITLDGKLSDWDGVPRETVNHGTMTSGKFGDNDSFTVSAAADANNLYVMMTSSDKNIITGQHGTDFWNEDSLEFYANLSGNLSAQSYGDSIFQVNINPGDIGKTDPSALTLTGTNAASSKVQGIVFKTDYGWGFEAALPLPFSPKHGQVIGFQAQANGATQADRDVKLIWSLADSGDNSWQNPSLFGEGIFFEIGQTDIPPLTGAVAAVAAVASNVTPTSTPAPQEANTVQGRAITAINQVGYFVNGQKIAIFGVSAPKDQPPAWELKAADTGASVATGTAAAGFMDDTSGDFVYPVDFSSFNTAGSYILSVDGVDSQPFQIANNLYAGLKKDALLYFYRTRSGIELLPQYAGDQWARPAGHLSDSSVTCFKGKSAGGQDLPGCDYHLDVSGGWYDAGDYGKYVVNGGIATWTLVNLYEHSPKDFADGSMTIPENANGWPDILDEARWEMDFMLRMQVPEGEPLAGMVHQKIHDRHWSGVPAKLPTQIDSDNPNSGRFLMPPSTAATLNLAATAAQCARVWKSFDAAFADRCLKAAEVAWKAAVAHPAVIYPGSPGDDGGGNYGDDNVSDEFYWAASELFITTGKDEYKSFVTGSPFFKNFASTQPMTWGGTAALGSISLAMLPNGLPDSDVANIRAQIVKSADKVLDDIAKEGYRVPMPPEQYVWGSNSFVLNNAIILALAHDFTGDQKYLDGVAAGLDYILGENAVNQSFVSGYGTVAMQHPHHRFWGDQPAQGFPSVPPGVVSGGPNGSPADPFAIQQISNMPISRRYVDDLQSYSTNEVAINWNAPLVWVAAYLDEQFNS